MRYSQLGNLQSSFHTVLFRFVASCNASNMNIPVPRDQIKFTRNKPQATGLWIIYRTTQKKITHGLRVIINQQVECLETHAVQWSEYIPERFVF